ncbi:nucleoid-associated protein [Aeromonas sp. sia0103]|uniref:nucleoid-associated protein n=1 Tax=Aeromonas sp. sia0103 TaxID=2854782 RepID=UPI001C47AE86|nr:nucleoid-associated protein [Aeromonas sp. sia0103]MBV7598961.1 nucleoid-associated protein [Aeromonas sp. sia0103]
MKVNKIIIHNLKKEQESNATEVIPGGTLLSSSDENTIKLVDRLDKLYSRRGNAAVYGSFSDSGVNAFPSAVSRYVSDESIDKEFISMSLVAMSQVEVLASKIPQATGGYIVFSHYEDDNEIEYILIASIKATSGLNISSDLKIISVPEIDLSKIHQAARINVSAFKNSKSSVDDIEGRDVDDNEDEDEDEEEDSAPPYLSFISPRTTDGVSGYFSRGLGCSDGVKPIKATKNTFKLVEKIMSHPELKDYRVDVVRSVTDYLKAVKDDKTSVASIDGIENAIKRAIPIKLHEYTGDIFALANSEEFKIPEEFNVHSKKLDELTRISIKSRKWEVNFDKNMLGFTEKSEIWYNEDGNSLVIRCNKELKAALDKIKQDSIK